MEDFLEPVDLSKYEGEDEVLSSEELFEYLNKRRSTVCHLRTGLPTLNDLIGGFFGGELTVISGITGNGKTLFAQTLTANFVVSNQSSLWFTYEVPMLQFLKQFGDPLPHFYMPKMLKGKDLDWIYERIVEAKLKYGISAVFIDHLHFLVDLMTSRNPSLEIGLVMRTLKRWALELDMSIFIIAHTGKIKPDHELDAGDTRDSSFIEQEADNVIYIWRAKNVENGAILKITKNRGRGIMGKKINLVKLEKYLVEIAHEEKTEIKTIAKATENYQLESIDSLEF